MALRESVALMAVCVAIWAAGCSSDRSCLRGSCDEVAPCSQLSFSCPDPAMTPPLRIGRVGELPVGLDGSQAATGDIVLDNGIVTAVISALEAATDLAPTGGNLTDFGPSGGRDDVTIVYQIAGILPDDAFAYQTLTVRDASPAWVGVELRGALDGRPEVEVVTRYELHACEPGLRVRSELWNGSPDVQAFVVADVSHWGKRRVAPFAPARGEGYLAPELELLDLSDLWEPFDYVGAATPAEGAPGYGVVACNQRRLEGVNDPEISALGTGLEVVRPGGSLVLERFVASAGAGVGPAGAISALLTARNQIFGTATGAPVTGRVVAGGLPFGGDARRVSILIVEGEGAAARPLTAVVPGDDGAFAVTVAGSALRWEAWSFGRVVAAGAIGSSALGDIEVPAPAVLQVQVSAGDGPDAPGLDALAVLHPADEATRAAVSGSFHGRFGTCAPWLGPPHGASPACNRALVAAIGSELEVPAGRYDVFATAGPEWSLARATVTLVAGEITPVALALRPLEVRPAGWLGADLHVHGRASFDSGLPDVDRVRSFVAAGVDVVAATDHDYVTDYAAVVDALGVGDRVAVMGGIEMTQLIPWLDVPGHDVPRVIGHFNFWPLSPTPDAPRGGAPWDERVEPGELFDRMAPLIGERGVMMINHPWDEPQFGRDLGYLRAIDFDPRRAVPDRDDGSANGELLRTPGGGHRNLDWDVMEVHNGAGADELIKTRPLWFTLLSEGHVTAAAANSDSHGLQEGQLGWPRTWVDAGTTVTAFDRDAFNTALRDGRAVGGTGVVIQVQVVGGAAPRGLGVTPVTAGAGVALEIEVRAAPWIPVHEVRAVTSRGERVLASGLSAPADPHGVDGVVRWRGTVPLVDLVTADDWIVIEAGMALPIAADLDGDGVPDTSDNDRDGDVDEDDIEPDEDEGPIENPPDPTDPADPRWLMTRVVPGSWPHGFTNPLLIDVDGGGWQAPGIGAER